MLVWLSFTATAIPAMTCGYDAQTRHANTGSDLRLLSAADYDSAVVPIIGSGENQAAGTRNLFGEFAKCLA